MAENSFPRNLGIKEETIERALSAAVDAHKHSRQPFIIKRKCCSSKVIYAFPETWSASNWFAENSPAGKEFGETKVDLNLFPSLRSIGNNEVATVNEIFLQRFVNIKENSTFCSKAENDSRKKQIIFTGHSGGGPVAIYATVWLFEYLKSQKIPTSSHFCLTFGSPITSDHIFGHALRREYWSGQFIHFVNRYDIIPRAFLAPQSTIEQDLQAILRFLGKNSRNSNLTFNEIDRVATRQLFENVMTNATCVANRAACSITDSRTMLADTISKFIELSPYRPFGTYVISYGKGKLAVVQNPHEVLQLLVYCSQLRPDGEETEMGSASLKEHLAYRTNLKKTSGMQDVVYFGKFQALPLDAHGDVPIDRILDDLGLSARARLSLLAAREWEAHKSNNLMKIDSKRKDIEKAMSALEKYRTDCKSCGVGYYDAFKLQSYAKDFEANIKRLEQAGLWDEIIEMLKKYELLEGFEGDKTWVELGTRYRRLVEPLDIANYYRTAKDADTGVYMKPGVRPKRYWYTQRWREHSEKMQKDSSGESSFWAEVEELKIKTATNTLYSDVKNRIDALESKLKEWYTQGEIEEDVFLPESTLFKWWKTLPYQYRADSWLQVFISS